MKAFYLSRRAVQEAQVFPEIDVISGEDLKEVFCFLADVNVVEDGRITNRMIQIFFDPATWRYMRENDLVILQKQEGMQIIRGQKRDGHWTLELDKGAMLFPGGFSPKVSIELELARPVTNRH